MNENPSVRLGASGWINPAWQGSFYPVDMPEDWHLTFFNTQFNCVYLDQSFWRNAHAEEWARWHADTHEMFLFLLEGDGPVPDELVGKTLMIQPDDASILWFSRESSLRELATSLSAGAIGKPFYLISQDGDLGQIERVATLLEVMGLGL